MKEICYGGRMVYTDKTSKEDTEKFKNREYKGYQGKIGKLEPEVFLDELIILSREVGEIVGLEVGENQNMSLWYCRNALAEGLVDKPLLREVNHKSRLIVFPSGHALELMLNQ